MGGFLGIGHSGSKTDRGAQLGARQGEWNIFNWGLPQGQQQQTAGQENVNAPASYFSQLLNPTRASTRTLAAPAVNAAQEQSDAANRQAAAAGTARGGGTAAANAERQTQTQQNVDNIVNQNLVAGRQAGAEGLEGIGKEQLANSAQLLGISQQALEDILNESTMGVGAKNNQAAWGGSEAAGQAAAMLIAAA